MQRGAAQPGQGDAGGVAQQARLDDLQGEGVIALADESGSGGGELLIPAPGQQVECGGALGGGRRLESLPVRLPVAGALVVEPLGEVVADDQVGNDRRGVVTEHRREAGLRQDVREGAAVRMPSRTWPCSRVSAASRPATAPAVKSSVSVEWPWMSRRGRRLPMKARASSSPSGEPSAANGCPR